MLNTGGPTEPNLGEIIRRERTCQKLTLDDLSRLSGVSKGMLSQIEQAKTNPTVAMLLRIAGGLRVEPTRLLPSSPATPRVWRVIRGEDEGTLFPANPTCSIRTLSPLNLEKQVELYELTFKPDGALVSEPHFRGTEEILSVVRGQVAVCSGDNETRLKEGDSVHYAADLCHRISNTGPSLSVCTLLVWYR
jgi:transcriptional regulator with XRE-family HTH domain